MCPIELFDFDGCMEIVVCRIQYMHSICVPNRSSQCALVFVSNVFTCVRVRNKRKKKSGEITYHPLTCYLCRTRKQFHIVQFIQIVFRFSFYRLFVHLFISLMNLHKFLSHSMGIIKKFINFFQYEFTSYDWKRCGKQLCRVKIQLIRQQSICDTRRNRQRANTNDREKERSKDLLTEYRRLFFSCDSLLLTTFSIHTYRGLWMCARNM